MVLREQVKDVLNQGGVEVPSSEKEDYLSILESWIGLPGAKLWETEMMEDLAPFDLPFYQALECLLVNVWQPQASSTAMLHSNIFLEKECDPKDMSLYTTVESVRVTRLIRYWLELNVLGNATMLGDDESLERTQVSYVLLARASVDETSPQSVNLLIQALYYHIKQLPSLQSQLYFYTQSLTRGELSSSGQAMTNPQARLTQYMEIQQITAKLNQEWEEHIADLECIIGEWYALGTPEMRRQCRSHLGAVWSQFISRSGGTSSGVKMENTTSSGIKMTLRVLLRILQGTQEPLQRSHEHLLTYHLIPLHKPNSMVLWRDQTSLLELYHEPLVQCIAVLLQKQPMWIPRVLEALMDPNVWTKGGNTPKLVLLLHEVDTYLGLLPDPAENPAILGDTLPSLLRTLATCMSSDHSRLAERALTFTKNKRFHSLVEANFEQSLMIMLPFLVKREPSWNPTVRKMTYNVLKGFHDYDPQRFLNTAAKCLPSDRAGSGPATNPMPRPKAKGTAENKSQDNKQQTPQDFSLKAAMGHWKPPPSTSKVGMPPPSRRAPQPVGTAPRGAAPPLAVTGVAPWSVSQAPAPRASRSRNKNPPLGVTGVAPWAMTNKAPTSTKRPAGVALSELTEEAEEESNGTGTSTNQRKPRVLEFMEQIKPPEQDGGTSSWSKAQMAETPTLLPDLRFYDLVFGHDLGEGAFGSVRYARLIDRTRTRSQWAEYAVKVISTEKIQEMGYEGSVQRELAVLRVLSHPGIARLVSSFRFREGVYLVLEYASGGDLHGLLQKNGSLDHDSTRFVMGEVVAALSSIHDMGLVYGDLKPENIVLTEAGHVKLTDFGGCRPVTEEAKKLIESAARNLLKDLRDGDWKEKSKKKPDSSMVEEDGKEEEEQAQFEECNPNEDLRVEGTTAYLPPEVVLGGIPSLSADSWALGCVLYQCLSGRPPILEAEDSLTRTRIVSFDTMSSKTVEEELFGETHGANIEEEARSLITQLLNRHAVERPSIAEVAKHEFFSNDGTDVFSLYLQAGHPLDVGQVAPVADAQWSRRQFSSIWAPQPQAYDTSLQPHDNSPTRGTLSTTRPIPEGKESTAFFSKSSTPLDLLNISEDKIPLAPSRKIAEE